MALLGGFDAVHPPATMAHDAAMRQVIQVFHPDLAASRANRRWAKAAESARYEVRDLYQLYPDGKIDIQAEQSVCETVDRLVFQHPLHWYGAPWLLKRWIDEVLTYGWGYGDGSKLGGKEWLSAVTVGAAKNEYGPAGSRHYTIEEFLRPFERTAAFCGMRWREPHVAFGTGISSEAELDAAIEPYLEALRPR